MTPTSLAPPTLADPALAALPLLLGSEALNLIDAAAPALLAGGMQDAVGLKNPVTPPRVTSVRTVQTSWRPGGRLLSATALTWRLTTVRARRRWSPMPVT
ncbi:MAG: hypothetical protein FJ033_15625 [Chloroflexi bacterium]|nr:hypothetical protein [Chloroflexota bacterium]